jgi:hypothetical protein
MYYIVRFNSLSRRGKSELSNKKPKQNLKARIALMEKEIFRLKESERAKARIEYQKLLKSYSKECGLEEPIYITRA